MAKTKGSATHRQHICAVESNQWSFSQYTPVMWWARGRCGIIFPWLARGRTSVPQIPLRKQEPHHLLLLGSRCPRGLVALFNILIGERRLRFVWVVSTRGCPRARDRSLLINFGTDRLARTWMMLDKGKLREKLRPGGEKLEREREKRNRNSWHRDENQTTSTMRLRYRG